MARQKKCQVTLTWDPKSHQWIATDDETGLTAQGPTTRNARTYIARKLANHHGVNVEAETTLECPPAMRPDLDALEATKRQIEELEAHMRERRLELANRLLAEFNYSQAEAAAAVGITQGYLNRQLSLQATDLDTRPEQERLK